MILIRAFEPADAPWIIEAHQRLYARDEGFDQTFGPLVADILVQFVAGHDRQNERGWVAEGSDGPLGCVFCVRLDDKTAQLRLFLVQPEGRGQGIGQRLLDTLVDFARNAGYGSIRLWTHAEHTAACALYRKNGWLCVASKQVHSFGRYLTEQTWTFDVTKGA